MGAGTGDHRHQLQFWNDEDILAPGAEGVVGIIPPEGAGPLLVAVLARPVARAVVFGGGGFLHPVGRDQLPALPNAAV